MIQRVNNPSMALHASSWGWQLTEAARWLQLAWMCLLLKTNETQ